MSTEIIYSDNSSYDDSNLFRNWFDARAHEASTAGQIIGTTNGSLDALDAAFASEEEYYETYAVHVEQGVTRLLREPLQDTPLQRTYHKARNALVKAALSNRDPERAKTLAIRNLQIMAMSLALKADFYESK